MKTGDIIKDRYKLINQLQTAWLADDLSSGRPCLLRCAADFIDPPVAEWLGRIWHPGLPRLLESFLVEGAGELFVFEYREGTSLRAKADDNAGRLSDRKSVV